MSDPFVGEIRLVGFNYAPDGWALANGALLPIAQNTVLFSLLGTTFGGDGAHTFGLPDYQGRSPVGVGQGPGLGAVTWGQKGGAESVNLSVSQLPPHTAPVQVSVAVPAVNTGTASSATPAPNLHLGVAAIRGGSATIYTADANNTTLAPFNAQGSTTPVGSGLPVALRNPYLGTCFIIALQGIFPSRP